MSKKKQTVEYDEDDLSEDDGWLPVDDKWEVETDLLDIKADTVEEDVIEADLPEPEPEPEPEPIPEPEPVKIGRHLIEKISVFVQHWGGEEDEHRQKTIDCLESWFDEALELNAQIVLIDNGSPVPFKAPKGKGWSKVNIVRLDPSEFLIDAFNRAIMQYPSEVYICVTNDTKKDAGFPFLAGLVDVLQNTNVGLVSPGTNDSGSGTLFVPKPGIRPDHSTRHIDNTVWAWRQDVVDRVGLPSNEGHTHRACWYCNKDYCERVRNAGYQVIAATGSSYVWHAHMGGQDMDAHNHGRAWLEKRAKALGYRFQDAW